jgi:Mg-chelatase subunit ChlD
MANNSDQNICALCLETTVAVGGGVPLASPGCCGKWFHQRCLEECMQRGNGLCPCCRAPFNAATPAAPPAQVVEQPVQNIFSFPENPTLFQRAANIFGHPSHQQQPIRQRQHRPHPAFFSRANGSNPNDVDMTEDELPIPSDSAEASASAASSSNADGSVGILLSSATEYAAISAAAQSSFYAIASIKMKEDSRLFERRKGMDLVCVLDKSGSMSGAKFTALKHAMRFVQSQLSPNDRLSIITFDNDAHNVHGLMCMNQERKAISEGKLNSLSAGGGTSILDGMKAGYNVLRNRRNPNTISCLFLLTDGVDNSDLQEKKRLAGAMKSEGTGLYVFAFGADHDSAHLNEIASAAESSYIYVESADEVIDAFGGALGSQQGLAAKNLAFNIAVPTESGIRLEEVNAGDYSVRIAAGSSSAEVKFSNLFCGEKRDVLVRLCIPAAAPGDILPDPQFGLFSLSATYQPIGYDTRLSTTEEENCLCTVTRVPDGGAVASAARDVEVDAQIYRLKVTELLKQAMDIGDRNMVEQARTMLGNCLTEITSQSVSYKAEHAITTQLVDDLKTAINGMRDQVQYRSMGGRSLMTEAYSSNVQQRCHMSKGGKRNAYQSSASDNMQTSSKTYKSNFY